MNVERMVHEFVERAEQDRTDGVGRMLARRVRRAGWTPVRLWGWALFWLLVGALVGWWTR